MLHNFYAAYFILSFVIRAQGEGVYTVIAPGTLRSYFDYNVAVTVHEAEEPCEIEVGISGSKYNISKTVEMLPMSTKTVEFEMPKLERDQYRLSVKGVSGITFESSTELRFASYDPLVYIQIDKPIYKAGDLVQFRVLFLNQKTYPEHLKKPMTIIVEDNDYHSIQRWKNINLTHGVYTDNFQLPDNSFKDWFHIGVYDGESFLQKKTFGVIKYDLPNFEVFVDVPENVAVTDEFMTVTVRSKYTFGKPVKGKATISIVHDASGISTNKMFPVDGKGHAELNILKDLPRSDQLVNGKISFRIRASFEDELTGKKQNSPTKYFQLHKNDIIMTALNRDITYRPDKLTKYTVVGKKFNGSPVEDYMNTVELMINDFVFYSVFNKSGLATFNFVLPEFKYRTTVYSSYLGTKTYLGLISTEVDKVVSNLEPERFQLNLLTQKPQLKKDMLIEVKWTEPITYFVYIVVARGNIVKVERVEVPNNSQSYIIKIIPTLDMIPTASIFVQYIFDDNLRFEEQTIEFENDFENTLEISASAEASPGDDIEFQISTDPNSYVGLLGIDQSILLYGTDHDLDQNNIFRDLRWYRTFTRDISGYGRYPGKISGLVSLTNAHSPWVYESYYEDSSARAPPLPGGVPVPRIRFPETWIFENFNITNQTQFRFTKKIPDTITSWVITGFSMNSNTGFALAKNPTKIQVFKTFFITIDLPYSVKQGEIISLPVLVFNYMNKTVSTEVTLDNSDEEFDFVEATNEIEERAVNKTKDYKRISLPPNSAGRVYFLIRPKTVGVTTIKATAVTALAGDSVQQTLKVESEGVTQYHNRAFFINLSNEREQRETITVDVPANAVPNSEYVELSAIGDLVGLSISHIKELVRLPIGTGEQNMIYFVPSILILKYLKTIDKKMPNVTQQAEKTLKVGYLKELRYRHNDGSYSAFGKSDTSGIIHGSTWLTAYVVRSFQQASEFIDIDQGIISDSLRFLAKKQTTNGNFAEFGHLLDFPHLNDRSLTAFVLLAFLENTENSSEYETHIKKGITFLIRSFHDEDDTYSRSIIALVLQKANHFLADKYLNKLKLSAKNENGLTWWSADIQGKKQQKYAFTSSDIEITSYILLAMLEKGSTEEVLPIIKWLTMQRNSKGGFTSTQDTVVGLQALIKFAEKTGLSHTGSMDIEYISEGNGVEDKGTIAIIPEKLLMLNTHELPKSTRKVSITAKGNASSLVQLSYKYNTIDKEPEQSFRLNITVRDNTPPKLLIIDICAEFVPTGTDGEEKKTSMIVIKVDLPSSYTTGSEDLQKLRGYKNIVVTETEKSDTVAIIYLHSLEVGNENCFSVTATKIHEVAKQRPVPVVLYDFSNKERSATEFYEIKSSLCEICDGDDCAVGCRKSEQISSNGSTFDL